MGQNASPAKSSPLPAASLPRHALEGAEASGSRIQSAVRRVAIRIATALDATPGPVGFNCHYSIHGFSTGRRDAHDGLFGPGALCGAIAIEPVHVPALVITDRAFAATVVECSYGGRPTPSDSARSRRTGSAEARAFTGLISQVAAALHASCEDRLPVSAEPLGTFDADDARDLISAGEAVAIIAIDVAVAGPSTPFRVTIVLPLAALRASSVLQTALSGRDEAARRRWAETLSARAGDIAMPARSVLARPMLSMGQLMALRPGDVIPIPMPRHVPLLIADRRVATGTIGERDGRVAFLISELEREDAQ